MQVVIEAVVLHCFLESTMPGKRQRRTTEVCVMLSICKSLMLIEIAFLISLIFCLLLTIHLIDFKKSIGLSIGFRGLFFVFTT